MLPILFFMSFEWFVFAVFLLFAPKLLYEISGIILLNGWVFNQFVLMLKHSLLTALRLKLALKFENKKNHI